MAGVLEIFFRIAMVLSIILIGINSSIVVFGTAMTGESVTGGVVSSSGLAGGSLTSADQNGIYGGTDPTDVIAQTATDYAVPQWSLGDWVKVQETVLNLGFGYQTVLGSIFARHNLESIGWLLRVFIFTIQCCGLAYIPFALWSTWKGGGAP